MFSGGIWHRSMNENVERLKEFKKIKEIYSVDLANTATILYFFLDFDRCIPHLQNFANQIFSFRLIPAINKTTRY